jgi:RNA polymerase sigma-70 factor (ECF subfamily)
MIPRHRPDAPQPAPPSAAEALERACRRLQLDSLIERMAARDESALTEFHRIMADRLFSMAVRMLGDRESAAEALQDAMIRLWRSAARFDPARGDAFTWSAMILRGLCLDRLRRRQRENGRTLRAPDAESASRGGLEDLFFRETIGLVQQAMNSLEAAERDCLCAALFRPETIAEYAAALGLSTGALKVRIHRAMQRLRALLEPHTAP